MRFDSHGPRRFSGVDEDADRDATWVPTCAGHRWMRDELGVVELASSECARGALAAQIAEERVADLVLWAEFSRDAPIFANESSQRTWKQDPAGRKCDCSRGLG